MPRPAARRPAKSSCPGHKNLTCLRPWAGALEMQRSPRVDTTVHVTIILNASAGGSEKEAVRDRLVEMFGSSGRAAQICLARSGKEIVELAGHAARQAGGTIVAAGGDGTINAVASALVGTDTPLGILPLGTLNHFAKDLRIPLDLESAARTIIARRMIRVDVGEVNGRIFLNNSSLGIYPRIVEAREEHRRRGRGK